MHAAPLHACLTWAMKAGHRRVASDRHFKPLLPSPPCGLADNGNLITGTAEWAAAEKEGGVCGPSFVRNSLKCRPSYLSTGALCNGILHCHFASFIFREGYYCCHTPHIPLGFVCWDRVSFFFHPVQNISRSLHMLYVHRNGSWWPAGTLLIPCLTGNTSGPVIGPQISIPLLYYGLLLASNQSKVLKKTAWKLSVLVYIITQVTQ